MLQVIPAAPWKRCEKELYGRLAFLLSELEPWEGRLLQANKKAKLRVRKEHESYVEEPEPKVRTMAPNMGFKECNMHDLGQNFVCYWSKYCTFTYMRLAHGDHILEKILEFQTGA